MRKIAILLALMLLSMNIKAINLDDGMIPMSLVSFDGKKVDYHDFGVLVLTYDPTKVDWLPLISFTSFKFQKSGGQCFAVRSDIDELNVEGNFINFRGKEAVNAVPHPTKVSALNTEHIKRDAYEYGHSFLLTDIGTDEASKYRLEVTRYFKPEIVENKVWVYESRLPIVDSVKSPCADMASDLPASDLFR